MFASIDEEVRIWDAYYFTCLRSIKLVFTPKRVEMSPNQNIISVGGTLEGNIDACFINYKRNKIATIPTDFFLIKIQENKA